MRITLNVMRIFGSAYRHGFTDDEIAHAWDNALGFYDIDADQTHPRGCASDPTPPATWWNSSTFSSPTAT